MEVIGRILTDPATYRRLTYLLSAFPLGLVWFVALVTVWSLCLGLAITPFVIPLLIGLAAMTRGFAAIEADLARSLLGVDAHAPRYAPRERGFLARLRAMFDGGFWRAQALLLLRWFLGWPVAVVLIALLASAIGMIAAPAWVPFVHGGADLGLLRPHTFLQSLALVPAGIVLLPATLLLARPLGAVWAPIAAALLSATDGVAADSAPRARRPPRPPPRRALSVHAAVAGTVVLGLVVIWAVTSHSYFWPIWVALPLATGLAVHGWIVLLRDRPSLLGWFRGSQALATTTGVAAAAELFLIAVWAVTSHGYFWPIWPLLAIAIVLASQTVAVLLSGPGQAELTERIETLESSRAGAVDLQDSELRRIERDLHDGAQARLVALGMSLGMAEQKLVEDPQRVGELLAEARVGAEQALRELRDLARGFHPPVLADRGLEAAVAALANSTPMRVTLSVDVARRPAPAVESAAYFVVAEALANAVKHARAERVDIRIARAAEVVELEITDDGAGGANPNGSGLHGLRRRVEALDGRLTVSSPPAGPTRIRAELPCG